MKPSPPPGDVRSTAPGEQVTTTGTGEPETVEGPAFAAGFWGRYELRERLGEGGQGAVYRAWDPQLQCEIALKVMKPRLGASDARGERVLREGRALARVRHPHVVNVYGVETHQGQIGLCMEHVRGQTLEDLVTSHGVFGEQEAIAAGLSVGRALSAVHAAGLVHRDVKARNVMRDDKGRIVLMDFGTGQDSAGADAMHGDIVGTPAYMAPEVLTGGPATARSDVYSLGVLLYHLVSARYPVEGRDFAGMVEAHRQKRQTPLLARRPDLSDGFVRIVDRATADNPSRRYESAAALVHDLVALEADPVPAAATAETTATTTRVLRAAGWIAGAALGVTLLGFITSLQFNTFLERTSVTSESFVDWFIWGLRSLVGPIGDVAQYVVYALFVVALVRLVSRVATPVDRAASRLAVFTRRAADRLGVGDPSAFAQFVFLIACVYLAIFLWAHWPLVGTFVNPVSALTTEQRALLSPAAFDLHLQYRARLDFLVLGTGLALVRFRRLRARMPGAAAWPNAAAVAAVFTLATILWCAPYRLLFQADFPRVEFNGGRCYDLGRGDGETLLYCPESAAPRVRRVAAGDPRVTDTGVRESVFTAQ